MGESYMITVGIKEIRNNLSRYLARVKSGEEVQITERGKPIARIIKETQGKKSIGEALGPLIGKGLITLPTRSIRRNQIIPEEVPGKPVSEIVIKDRR